MVRITSRCIALMASVIFLTYASISNADLLWECPKTFTMSSNIGISDHYNGTDYIRYVEGQFICDMKGPGSNECYFKYQNVMEGDGAVIGFHRQKSHPKDTQVIVLDLRNDRFYKTVEQGDLRVTIFGDCQNIGEDRLQVRKTLKDDALALMGAIVLVPGIAAYCNKHVARNEELIEAASRWNEKNASFMKRIIHVIESEGGLSKAEKEIFDKMAFLMVKKRLSKPGTEKPIVLMQ